ncbi:MAG: tRNA (adenosine(37)-N6)-dimethylallyltransferase MiaA [Bacteroidetes bacterium]|nr:tRNA (adenosine(37)-N6)-dimethylallyltransferase MiaA [Bacteroidota bacterium]
MKNQVKQATDLKNSNSNKTLIVIVGPTAVGKTALSIEIAQHFKTEIVSADSRQFYKELKIGTAPPSAEELEAVKHHFIGNLSIKDYYNVAKFEEDALNCLEEIFEINDFAVLVGGSGMYIDAVCKGIDDLPNPDEELRSELKKSFEENGIEFLRMKVKHLDPDFYAIADLANPKRLMRALEVCLMTGKPYSSFRKNHSKPRSFKIVRIGLNKDRTELFARINQRVDEMIKAGLVEEAKSFFPEKELNSLNTVGYKELFEYFENKISLEKAIENIKTNSRRYAKRQLTWFRKDESIIWFSPEQKCEIIEKINQ